MQKHTRLVNSRMLWFLTDLSQVNKSIKRKPYPLPNISDIIQKLLERFILASALDLNMGYSHKRLDPNAQDICILKTPWGSMHFNAYQ